MSRFLALFLFIVNDLIISFLFASDALGEAVSYDPNVSWVSRIQPGKPLPVAPYAAGVSKVQSSDAMRAASLAGAALLDPTFDKCGQACLYQKSKEALSVQMEFVLSKRKLIQVPELTDTQIRAIAGVFCYDAESGVSCRKRYLKWTDFWLLKARGSLTSSNQSIAALMTDLRMGSKVIAFSVADESQKATQMPYVITVEQLRALAQGPGLESLNRVQSNEDWIQSCLGTATSPGLKPEPMDFAKFKKILRDPDYPGAGFLEIPDGFDSKAYQAALKDWEKFTGSQSRQNQEGLYATLRGRSDPGGGIQQQLRNRQNQLLLSSGKGQNTPEQTPESTALDLQLFKASRVEYIQQVNQLRQEETYTRKKVQPTLSSTFTGNEQVNASVQDSQTQRSVSASFEPSFIQPRTGTDPSLQNQNNLDGVSDTGEVIFFPDVETAR